MERISIYFGDTEVVITSVPPGSHHLEIVADTSTNNLGAKIRKNLGIVKCVVLLSSEPMTTFEQLKREFVLVEAAGGVVQNERGELLMIELRGRWDLPKGHIEVGEEACVAALREVEEETGVVAELVDSEPLMETWHAYDTYGRWELKRTRWWQMRALGGELKAQDEEGIARVEWCDACGVEERLKNSYATIKHVVETLLYKVKG
ncbi:MAG: NUDIX domain-containing protein [Alistipes sp.]|nr:NUDIX domain-containing protein [Alistipes sp.]